MLYFIDKAEDLVGKTIAFTHMAKFADRITIVTTDGGVYGVRNEYNDEDDFGNTIEVFNKQEMEKYLFDNEYLKGELFKLNIISQSDIDEYKEQQRIAKEKWLADYKMKEELAEKQQLERLKAKYKDQS